MSARDGDGRGATGSTDDDAAKAVKFMIVKAAIFILVPLIAAAIAVVVVLR